jgi:hypothetical protein
MLVTGYSDPSVYPLSLLSAAQRAYEQVSRTVLEDDEALAGVTAFLRPTRGVAEHVADAAAKRAALPDWVGGAGII